MYVCFYSYLWGEGFLEPKLNRFPVIKLKSPQCTASNVRGTPGLWNLLSAGKNAWNLFWERKCDGEQAYLENSIRDHRHFVRLKELINFLVKVESFRKFLTILIDKFFKAQKNPKLELFRKLPSWEMWSKQSLNFIIHQNTGDADCGQTYVLSQLDQNIHRYTDWKIY